MNLQQIQPVRNHFLGENLLQPQIRGSTSLVRQYVVKSKFGVKPFFKQESVDFDQNAKKDTTKSHVKEQSSHTVKTKHVSHKKKKHKKRYH